MPQSQTDLPQTDIESLSEVTEKSEVCDSDSEPVQQEVEAELYTTQYSVHVRQYNTATNTIIVLAQITLILYNYYYSERNNAIIR